MTKIQILIPILYSFFTGYMLGWEFGVTCFAMAIMGGSAGFSLGQLWSKDKINELNKLHLILHQKNLEVINELSEKLESNND